MKLIEQREQFELTKKIYERAKLSFKGVEAFDVYNVSIPFTWEGKDYIFGRVEKREEWARSWVRLFERTGQDEWSLVQDSMIYPLEDPYISIIGDLLVMGGTHVRYKQNGVDTYFGYFYRGTQVDDLYYFTTGPEYMKDIRLVEMHGGKIGVFSRPRSEQVRQQYGSESMIGFTVIDCLDDLTEEVVENAPYIHGLFGPNEWGGCNQAYLLESGNIGVIGHICYKTDADENGVKQVYMNFSFVLDVASRNPLDQKIIGTRTCYPEGPAKKTDLTDCAFSSGIVMRDDGKCDLYSGIGDTEAGRIVIDYPFEGHGCILSR
ncbi:DUF1861 family protein [Paenibacillus popilliae]|uniref:DUF1861 family protein n=1 Tax=Paenibacillus popilliae ATCC 14706 TaxID=1212764 RepID=M9LAT4_PAEPP|nr:DUF1861 family protein [Paenibacillus popilliae]GAC42827.1 hypothetical protein PPOP_2187 [Paenibacillus popilliae ATCC 14706]